MSLPRKDVKFWLDPEYHAALREICDMRGLTLGEFVEDLVVTEVDRVLHEASELHARTARLGIVWNQAERAVHARNGQESLGIRERGGRR
jgi:hypothetical protein